MADPETPAPAEPETDENALETPDSDVDALETPETPEGAAEGSSTTDATSSAGSTTDQASAKPPKVGLKQRLKRFNVFLLLFLLILVVAGGIVLVAYFDQLASTDATVGSDQQVLKVESSAIFAGKVLVRDGLEVAGNLQIGGTVGLTNLTVSGTSQLGETKVNKNLSVAGDTAIQGGATIAKSLQVSGSGSFGGPLTAPQITTSNLQLSGDLILTHHLTLGGSTPSRSNGSALGSGGTATISGSDTGGTVTINIGSGAGAGCFITVNFTQKFNAPPRVLITPVGSSAGSIAYYVNRTSTSFSICDAAVPPAGASFGFDYFVFN
jgi:cytoskeletal protein CcmA (bactofilin family)